MIDSGESVSAKSSDGDAENLARPRSHDGRVRDASTTTADESRTDLLTAALTPVLIHRLNNTTQLLQAASALLALSADSSSALNPADDLAHAARTIDELGWLLALLASASGHELLLARRERRGLDSMVRAVREAARRAGREIEAHAVALPDLEPAAGDGWRVPWAVGTWLLTNSEALPADASLAWRLQRAEASDELGCRVPDHAGRGDLEQRIAVSLPGASFRRTRDEHVLLLPRRSLAWGS
jgi:hypothetical protein